MARLVLAPRIRLDRRAKLQCIRGKTGTVHELDGGTARSSGRFLHVTFGMRPRSSSGPECLPARQFEAWQGGGEYNVARGLCKCFGPRTAVVTALADNPVGRLIEDLMCQGGVDTSYVALVTHPWVP